jgi:uncharacterized protein YlxW (UPF0749 family)
LHGDGLRLRPSALRSTLGPLAILVFAAQLAAPAQGALFDDDEARRRIVDLKTRVDQIERTLAQRVEALEAKSAAQEAMQNKTSKEEIAHAEAELAAALAQLEAIRKLRHRA